MSFGGHRALIMGLDFLKWYRIPLEVTLFFLSNGASQWFFNRSQRGGANLPISFFNVLSFMPERDIPLTHGIR